MDGRHVFYLRDDPAGVWQLTLDGGDETPLFEATVDTGNWAVAASGIYYLNRIRSPFHYTLEFFDFDTRRAIQKSGSQTVPRGLHDQRNHGLIRAESDALRTTRSTKIYDLMLVENLR